MARDTTRTSKGFSLAKGPVGIVGLIGIAYGLSALIFASHGFALHIPHGTVHGKKWIGLEVNGWSELLFIAAGLALLLAAPLHWGAKGMSLIVGLVMIAAAIVAAIRTNGVFGIFAANHLTELVWAAAGVLLIVLALLPRVGGAGSDEKDHAEPAPPRRRARVRREENASTAEPQFAPVVTRDADAQQSAPVVTRDADVQQGRTQQVTTQSPRSAGARTTNDTNLDKEIR